MALKGIKVLELSGLAPAPLCGMFLRDFGASVIFVTKIEDSPFESNLPEYVRFGKKTLKLNLKNKQAIDILKKFSKNSDVIIDPFRRGVMEKLGLGPEILTKENPKLIYARLTGYGQTGPYSDMAGHDINYLGISGVLSLLGRKNDKPFPPINLLADFAGGSILCAFGILSALYERSQSGLGQVIDSNLTEGAAYLASWLFAAKSTPILNQPRGENILDGGAHFYDTYATKDGKYVAVGAIEPKFYDVLLKGLKLTYDEAPQFGDTETTRKLFEKIFLSKDRAEWMEIFTNTDACVTPVLEVNEVHKDRHNNFRKSFFKDIKNENYYPTPAPILSRTPADTYEDKPKSFMDDTIQLLQENNYTKEEIENLIKNKVIPGNQSNSKL